MAILKLPAGTDVAEMALFSSTGVPERLPNSSEEVDELVRARKLMRFPTGGDGGYLLHAYVDEPVPGDIRALCEADDPIDGVLELPDGCIAFGGLESCSRDFDANEFIRRDATIPAGTYAVTALRTDIPQSMYEAKRRRLRARFSASQRALRLLPRVAVFAAIPLVLVFAVGGRFLPAFACGVAAFFGFRLLARIPAVARVRAAYEAARSELDLEFPSMVAQLRRQ